MKWLIELAVLLAILLGAAHTIDVAYGMQLQGNEYFDSTGKVTMQWDSVPQALGYNIRAIMFDKVPETTYAIGHTTQTQIDILRPRSGHFRFEAQACRFADCSCTDATGATLLNDCPVDRSNWAQSTDPAHASVDGVAMGWWVYFKTPVPTF